MASWQARVTNAVLRLLVKTSLKRQVRLQPARIATVRRRGAWCARWLVRPLKGTSVRPVDEAGVRGEWIRAPGARQDRAVLYVHGGGFMIGSAAVYRHLVSRLARASGCSVLSLDYRLAPEHPYPAALEDVLDAWRWLTSGRLPSSGVALAGDSAGGNLVLSLLMRLRGSSQPLPAAVAVMAPWTDLSVSGDSVRANRSADPLLPAELLRPVANAYLQGADAEAADASPLFGDFAGFPPMLIHVGSTEILLDDALRLERAAQAAGVESRLKIWPRLPHVFQLFSPFVPEGRRSLEELGAFLRDRLGA